MVGETAALFCRGQGHPPLSLFRWYWMQGEGSIQLRENSERLSLSELTRDIASFRCVAINEMGETTSPVTVVNVECKSLRMDGWKDAFTLKHQNLN